MSLLSSIAPSLIKGIVSSTFTNPAKLLSMPFAAMDAFKGIAKSISGKPKQSPAGPFELKPPALFKKKMGPLDQLSQGLKSLSSKLTKIADFLEKFKGLMTQGKEIFSNTKLPGQQPLSSSGGSSMPSAGVPSTGTGGSSFSAPTTSSSAASSSGPTQSAQPGSSTQTGSSAPADVSGNMSDQWAMFNKMQSMQQSAQMFELAVKMAELKHQASMSAIRGIRY